MFFQSPELAEVPTYYDVIGFDPRGIGQSAGLHCANSLDTPGVPLFPTTGADFAALTSANVAIGADCRSQSGAIIDHVDSASAAKDAEAIRVALGEDKISWFTISYGTELAQEYALQFGAHVDRLALDGIVDHSLPRTASLITEAKTEEAAWDAFASWCESDASCALNDMDVDGVLKALLDRADDTPVMNSTTGRAANGTEIMLSVYGALLGHDNWPNLAVGLRAAAGIDAPADTSRLGSGATWARSDPAYRYIWCEDLGGGFSSAKEAALLVRALQKVAPNTWRYSEVGDIMSGCTGLPVEKSNPPSGRQIRIAGPALIVSNTIDPSTTRAWGLLVHRRIPGSAMLTTDAIGHTALFNSPCGRAAIASYLIDGRLPATSSCAG
jgi:pimeloyl-ACP methyl ester carboxylesterase